MTPIMTLINFAQGNSKKGHSYHGDVLDSLQLVVKIIHLEIPFKKDDGQRMSEWHLLCCVGKETELILCPVHT